jgi:spore germination protein GerM
MTSIWKLVEAELSPEAKAKLDSAEKAYADKQAANTNASFNKSKKSNNHRDSRKPQKSNRSDTVYYPDTPETRTYYASLAVEQM